MNEKVRLIMIMIGELLLVGWLHFLLIGCGGSSTEKGKSMGVGDVAIIDVVDVYSKAIIELTATTEGNSISDSLKSQYAGYFDDGLVRVVSLSVGDTNFIRGLPTGLYSVDLRLSADSVIFNPDDASLPLWILGIRVRSDSTALVKCSYGADINITYVTWERKYIANRKK